MATTFTTTKPGATVGATPLTETARLGMGLALTSITMLFTGLTSAYVVRRGMDPGWRAIQMPGILYLNTAMLLASGVAMEKARRARQWAETGRWLAAALALGLAFLGGQLSAWRQLSAGGIYLSTNPHSSFFFLLTALHGLHLLGGVGALGYLTFRVCRDQGALWKPRWVAVTALYWHFMDGLWIYLLVLLFWR